jgi:hypothetical protein
MSWIQRDLVCLTIRAFLRALLTHYGTMLGPIYFCADYVSEQKWRQLGLITSVSKILIRASVGLVWWKIPG